MTDVISSPFRFPAVGGKKVSAAFDGGRITSDGGVLLLAQAEREMDICAQLAACIADPRDPSRVRQFCVMKAKSRCSMRFHLLVPGG